MSQVKVIAEAGVNHNGRLEMALELVDVARAAGADCVKFQTFVTDKVISPAAPLASYQARGNDRVASQADLVRPLELSFDDFRLIYRHCSERGISFLSTAFDSDSLDFLARDLELTTLKIPSGELTNAPFVLAHAATGADLIVSTGMASIGEIETALGVIAFGLTAGAGARPGLEAFAAAYASEDGRQAIAARVTLLHCTTEYPAPMTDVNLTAMTSLRTAFGVPVGYSDHTLGVAVPAAATALGASVIEKHFTLDKDLPGPDHRASADPAELRDVVRAVRDVEVALGDGVKRPAASEIPNKAVARKSLVALRPIRAGEEFDAENLGAMRPGDGESPYSYWSHLGLVASRDYAPGELIAEPAR